MMNKLTLTNLELCPSRTLRTSYSSPRANKSTFTQSSAIIESSSKYLSSLHMHKNSVGSTCLWAPSKAARSQVLLKSIVVKALPNALILTAGVIAGIIADILSWYTKMWTKISGLMPTSSIKTSIFYTFRLLQGKMSLHLTKSSKDIIFLNFQEACPNYKYKY